MTEPSTEPSATELPAAPTTDTSEPKFGDAASQSIKQQIAEDEVVEQLGDFA